MTRIVRVLKAGKLSYASGLKLQSALSDLMKTNASCDNENVSGYLILIEHNPVYTIGIRSREYDEHIADRLRGLGAEFYATNRGGLITFHGPGQLVSYPILDLKNFVPSVRWYVSSLEKAIIATCEKFDLKAYSSPYTGVWVNDRKICAMGMRVSKFVTTHGLALNCDTDLAWFRHIVPCGIKDKEVTSLSRECGKKVGIEDAIERFLPSFSAQFECELKHCSSNFTNRLLNEVNDTKSEGT